MKREYDVSLSRRWNLGLKLIKMSPAILGEIRLLVVITAITSVSLSYFIELNSH